MRSLHVPAAPEPSPERKIAEALFEKGWSAKVVIKKVEYGEEIAWFNIKGKTGIVYYCLNDLPISKADITVEFKADSVVMHFLNGDGEKWETTAPYPDLLKMRTDNNAGPVIGPYIPKPAN